MKLHSMLLLVVTTCAVGQEITHVDAHTPREQQIALAKSAAPKEVSDHADIYILGANGYELVVRGANGFSCIVDREYLTTVEPECFDAEGSRTTLKVRIFQESQRAKGIPDSETQKAIEAGYKSGRFLPPAKPGIVYMLSSHNLVYDPGSNEVVRFPGHLMFYAPYATEKTVGSGKGAPYISHPGKPDALLIVVPRHSE